MKTDLLSRVRAFCLEKPGVSIDKPILAAVSGGIDSMTLLYLLSALGVELGFRVEVATVDHGLRPEAAEEALFVRQQAEKSGLSCHCLQLKLAEVLSPALSGNRQQLARRHRYQALLRQAEQIGATVIALGHTASDQAETVLLRLLRGSSLSGLAGMDEVVPYGSVFLVRPLLRVSRAEIVEFVRQHAIPFREDPTNETDRYERNRLRHHLLPALKTYNPAIEQTLVRTSRSLRLEVNHLNTETERDFNRLARCSPHHVLFRLAPLQEQSDATQFRLIKKAVAHLLSAAPTGAASPDSAAADLPSLDPGGIMNEQLFHLLDFIKHTPTGAAAPRHFSISGRITCHRLLGRLLVSSRPVCFPPWPATVIASSPFTSRLLADLTVRVDSLQPGETTAADDRADDETISRWIEPLTEIFFDQLLTESLTISTAPDLSEINSTTLLFCKAFQPHLLSAALTVRPWRPGDRFHPAGMTGRRKVSDLFQAHRLPVPLRPLIPLFVHGEEIVWIPGLAIATAWMQPDRSKPRLLLSVEIPRSLFR